MATAFLFEGIKLQTPNEIAFEVQQWNKSATIWYFFRGYGKTKSFVRHLNLQVSHRQHLRALTKYTKERVIWVSIKDVLAEPLKLEIDTKEIKSFLHSPTLRKQKKHSEKKPDLIEQMVTGKGEILWSRTMLSCWNLKSTETFQN